MKDLGKIAGLNILFILVYDILLRLGTDNTGALIFSIFLVAVQVLVNLILAIIFYSTGQSPWANSLLLCMLIVLIIGSGVCLTHF